MDDLPILDSYNPTEQVTNDVFTYKMPMLDSSESSSESEVEQHNEEPSLSPSTKERSLSQSTEEQKTEEEDDDAEKSIDSTTQQDSIELAPSFQDNLINEPVPINDQIVSGYKEEDNAANRDDNITVSVKDGKELTLSTGATIEEVIEV